jgi:hypothetical protein
MTYRNYVRLTAIVILGLTACVAYLSYDRASMSTGWWNAAVQNQEEALRRINSLESLLEHSELHDVKAELDRHRQHTLISLDGMINMRFVPGSANWIFAVRVYCAEVTYDSARCDSSGASSI